MSGPRIYGTFLDEYGLRHEASGVLDGTFSRKKGEWDSNTTCGWYIAARPYTNEDLHVTCLRCIGKRHVPVTLRGLHADMTAIDEAQSFDLRALPKEFFEALDSLPAEHVEGRIVVDDPVKL
jgi:hypothetical protein